MQASPGRVSRGQQQAIPRSQSNLSAKEAREASNKEGKPDPLNLQSVGTEHLDRFLASVEKVSVLDLDKSIKFLLQVNAEREHRLSDEYQSQTEIEPVRPKDKVGICKMG